ncbi:OsmC family protein [Spongisporangium articulatum]|uniref:OsmC family protein n=1 Tax=Spongisporangium articulatum TaxID=3362603 RepID=A0ABW8AT55_9ACTN
MAETPAPTSAQTPEQTPEQTPDKRTVTLSRHAEGIYIARNARGHELKFGTKDPDGFSPVELLLASIAACTAVDVDVVTGRHSVADEFGATVEADYIRDETGNRLDNIELTFHIRFPEGEKGDRARTLLPRALRTSHDRTCTVSRTIEAGTHITTTAD